ncbi:CDP-diacylglycerol--glycerol-3-phosphate 3-phosphatidyltransferase [Saxibacter everestensis]|uniref:CDP-diacylglycerol--glycerol-3-phosphate 3-phosphatidyltransferase n=1 Tax=Saxibacter everestensis TaxID=2909229 RepID=A0ABY8QY67_9MICO|nr:CDP-diacylglycerol--glycerol-3-phosphate 3-phosphatidyltransferase [Brevibacteriaceae bacterium ZFBP1038]
MTPAQSEVREPSVWNIANLLTVLRILMVPVFLWLLVSDLGNDLGLRIAALVVFAVAMLTDRIDGNLARKYNLITNFGKIADPIADKALLGASLIGLAAIDILPWWVPAVILVREVGITVLRFVVIRSGVMPASRGGKLKTVLQTAAVGLFLLPIDLLLGQPGGLIVAIVAWLVMIAAIVVTLVTGVDYVLKARVLVREASEHKETGQAT